MFKPKGQVATEYILITGFVLVAVTLIFTYAYVSNNQNIKITQANNALDKIVNKADLIYALGPDNNQFVEVTFPRDLTGAKILDLVVCEDGHQSHYDVGEVSCEGHGGVSIGALEIQLSLLGGTSLIRRPAKGEIEADVFYDFDGDGVQDSAGHPNSLAYDEGPNEGTYVIKVYWCGEKICLEKA